MFVKVKTTRSTATSNQTFVMQNCNLNVFKKLPIVQLNNNKKLIYLLFDNFWFKKSKECINFSLMFICGQHLKSKCCAPNI